MCSPQAARPHQQPLNLIDAVYLSRQELIDRAVNASGLTRTDFVLKAARAAAQDLLVEQAWSAVDPEAFEAFRRQLDAPANPNEAASAAGPHARLWSAVLMASEQIGVRGLVVHAASPSDPNMLLLRLVDIAATLKG